MEDKLNISHEIVYELKVSDVMTRNPEVARGDEKISTLRDIMRDKKISGFPVVNNNELIGIISIEDFIKALINKEQDLPIKERMTRNVECVYDDDSLISAIKKFERTGFGRFPVIKREDKTLVGIITKTDVISGLLKRLEARYEEEEIKKWRASHFFDDVIAEKKKIILEYSIEGGNFKKAGAASSNLKKTAKRLGIHPDIVRRLAIASYEGEMNVCIYAKFGRIKAYIFQDRIDVCISDKGPGIPDIEKAMTPGFSTAPDWVRELGFGAGMGLWNIKKCSSFFELKSKVGFGTNLRFSIM